MSPRQTQLYRTVTDYQQQKLFHSPQYVVLLVVPAVAAGDIDVADADVFWASPLHPLHFHCLTHPQSDSRRLSRNLFNFKINSKTLSILAYET